MVIWLAFTFGMASPPIGVVHDPLAWRAPTAAALPHHPASAPGSPSGRTFLPEPRPVRARQPFVDRILHGKEDRIPLHQPGDQLLQNEHAVSAADHERME